MSEKEIETLKSLPVPPARETAKRAAIAAALDAFEKSTQAPQASGDAARPTPQSQPETRRRFMTFTRSQYAMAASLAALIVAAPIAFHTITAPQPDVPVSTDASALQEAAKPEPRADLSPSDDRAVPEPMPDSLGAAGTGEPREAAKAEADKMAEEAQAAVAGLETERREAAAAGRDRGMIALTPSPAPMAGAPAGFTAGQPPQRDQPYAPGAAPNASIVADDVRGRVGAGREFRDAFEATDVGPLRQVATEPVSTFSIDVDTATYAFVRRSLNAGRLPPKAAVRTEEMINYFDYAYPAAESAAKPFKPTVTVVPSPWNSANRLVHIGIKGHEINNADRPRANLVLLVDVSGSMGSDDRLPLVKNGLRMLVDDLQPDDTVALVTYASGSAIALEPTKVSEKGRILAAIAALGAGGSTAGADGIQDAYRLAEQNFDRAAVNRIILATDGDFNVGLTDVNDLKGLIERKRDKGIFLSILGVGEGNYNDRLMQLLAQNGNGVAAYADTLGEARKVLVEEASSTLFPIARDVKIQVEWNPARVAAYRLIGYETRALRREDFNNGKVDAGDIGSGHTVTAIYEITPVGAASLPVDDLRYSPSTPAAAPAAAHPADAGELGFLKMRFKLPRSETSTPISLAITDAMAHPSLTEAPADVRFAIAVAGFAEILRGSPYLTSFGIDDVLALATPARGEDPFGERAEFLSLARLAKSAQP